MSIIIEWFEYRNVADVVGGPARGSLAATVLCSFAAIAILVIFFKFIRQAPKGPSRLIPFLVRCYVVAGVFALALYFLLASAEISVGGRPSKEKVDNGRYYVSEHGVYHEVSPSTFVSLVAGRTLLRWMFSTLAILTPIVLVTLGSEMGWRRFLAVISDMVHPRRPLAKVFDAKDESGRTTD